MQLSCTRQRTAARSPLYGYRRGLPYGLEAVHSRQFPEMPCRSGEESGRHTGYRRGRDRRRSAHDRMEVQHGRRHVYLQLFRGNRLQRHGQLRPAIAVSLALPASSPRGAIAEIAGCGTRRVYNDCNALRVYSRVSLYAEPTLDAAWMHLPTTRFLDKRFHDKRQEESSGGR